MTNRNLNNLISDLTISERNGDTDPEISSVVYDSREVETGSLFFALPGIHVDGHQFINKALDAGAAAVVHSEKL